MVEYHRGRRNAERDGGTSHPSFRAVGSKHKIASSTLADHYGHLRDDNDQDTLDFILTYDSIQQGEFAPRASKRQRVDPQQRAETLRRAFTLYTDVTSAGSHGLSYAKALEKARKETLYSGPCLLAALKRMGAMHSSEPPHRGRPPVLPPECEHEVVAWIDLVRFNKWQVFKDEVIAQAQRLLDLLQHASTTKRTLSDGWYYSFLHRNDLESKDKRPLDITHKAWMTSDNAKKMYAVIADVC